MRSRISPAIAIAAEAGAPTVFAMLTKLSPSDRGLPSDRGYSRRGGDEPDHEGGGGEEPALKCRYANREAVKHVDIQALLACQYVERARDDRKSVVDASPEGHRTFIIN